jgi:RimJ/RimL family protein N-acetyltransferase
MLGGEPHTPGLRLPPGGVDERDTLAIVRRMAGALRAIHDRGAWMMVADGEVVGLCSYVGAPNAAGEVEIGYGVAASRRNLGHATRAVAAILDAAAEDPKVATVVAMTASVNIASQRPLQRNGFVKVGLESHPEDGEIIRWRRKVA